MGCPLTGSRVPLELMADAVPTDALNARSGTAIARLGAREEGTLRSGMRTESGRMRDTVYYSILSDEWQTVKRRLEERLDDGNR